VVGGAEDIGVIDFSCFFEFLENTPDLDIDIFATGVFASDFVADRDFIAVISDAANVDFVPHIAMTVIERMSGQVIRGERRLLGIGGWQGILILVIGRAVFLQQFRCAGAGVVRM